MAFTLADVYGTQVSTSSYSGKPVVINFWAFWCDTWKAELPYLKTLAKQEDALGFQVVAVSVDGTRVSTFTDYTHGDVPFPVLLDIGGKVSAQYEAWHVPTVVILDGAGKVAYTSTGYPGNGPILSRLRWLANHHAPDDRGRRRRTDRAPRIPATELVVAARFEGRHVDSFRRQSSTVLDSRSGLAVWTTAVGPQNGAGRSPYAGNNGPVVVAEASREHGGAMFSGAVGRG